MVVVVVVVFLTDNNTTPTKIVLSCFGLLVGLWHFSCVILVCFSNISKYFWIFYHTDCIGSLYVISYGHSSSNPQKSFFSHLCHLNTSCLSSCSLLCFLNLIFFSEIAFDTVCWLNWNWKLICVYLLDPPPTKTNIESYFSFLRDPSVNFQKRIRV